MAKPVKWLRKALKNLEQVYDYIAEDDIHAAIGVFLKFRRQRINWWRSQCLAEQDG